MRCMQCAHALQLWPGHQQAQQLQQHIRKAAAGAQAKTVDDAQLRYLEAYLRKSSSAVIIAKNYPERIKLTGFLPTFQ
eukprot:COSAG05_NODE_723_length_7727_cov_19.327871_10_plen_78_part_00